MVTVNGETAAFQEMPEMFYGEEYCEEFPAERAIARLGGLQLPREECDWSPDGRYALLKDSTDGNAGRIHHDAGRRIVPGMDEQGGVGDILPDLLESGNGVRAPF